MLQQTQVATVLLYYEKWLRRFPNFAALASASENDVLHAWQGLGYYARARNLHAAAKIVQMQHRGKLPSKADSIRKLPGAGRYTANAVATFAFDQAVPILEANTTRVVARLFNIRTATDSAAGRAELWQAAGSLIPNQRAARFNSALIDLGAMICLPRKPRCPICPVKRFCRAPNPEILPTKKPRRRLSQLREDHLLTVHDGRILLEQSIRRWCGLWVLPRLTGDLNKSGHRPVLTLIFPFTCHRVTLRVFRRSRPPNSAGKRHRWFALDDLESIPIPSPHRRAIEQLLTKA